MRRNGEPRPSGWIAEQTSWRNPGSVSASVRAPPPIVDAASSTRTERPACAMAIAAASPFGPEPTTIASTSRSAIGERVPNHTIGGCHPFAFGRKMVVAALPRRLVIKRRLVPLRLGRKPEPAAPAAGHAAQILSR